MGQGLQGLLKSTPESPLCSCAEAQPPEGWDPGTEAQGTGVPEKLGRRNPPPAGRRPYWRHGRFVRFLLSACPILLC